MPVSGPQSAMPSTADRADAGIVFDLDETLVNRRGSLDGYAERLRAHYRNYTSLDSDAFNALFHELDGNGRVPRQTFFERLSKRAFRDLSADQIASHFQAFAWVSPLLFDDVIEVLERFRKQGFAIGVVTNGGSHSQNAKLRNSGLIDYVDAFVISEEFGAKKPDPSIYREIAARLGINVERSWFVGDDPISDVVGPATAGFRTAWIDRYLPWPEGQEKVYQQVLTHVSELEVDG